ncbi:MAG TPA: hypothetical protein VGD56_09915 [Gemmatirosa sp.]
MDAATVGRRLDDAVAHDPAAWRAAQLTALLVGADADAGPGGVDARWAHGVRVRPFDFASRAGISATEVGDALHRLLDLGVLEPVGETSDAMVGEANGVLDDRTVRVAAAYVTDSRAAAIAWSAVVERLSGSAAALLVVRALADHVDRPGRPTVMPYSALARATRYSEGMVKRGVAAAVAAGAVVQRGSPGRAPAYTFSEWALGRAAVSGPVTSRAADTPDVVRSASPPAATQRRDAGASMAGPSDAHTTGTLRASVAGVSFEVPTVSGGELVVETVVDGRPVTARLILPAARDERRSAG